MKSLLFAIILGWCAMPVFANETPPVRIEGLNRGYSLDTAVTITVTNLSANTVTYGIGVLRQVDGRWTELITNIEDQEIGRKAFKLRKLPGNGSQKFAWKPKGLHKPYLVKSGTYRVYIAFRTGENERAAFHAAISRDIGSQVGEHNQYLLYSDPFKLGE